MAGIYLPSWIKVLSKLMEKEGASQHKLARYSKLSCPAGIYSIIRSLEEFKIIEIRRKDRREKDVFLTEEGRKLAEACSVVTNFYFKIQKNLKTKK